MEYSFLKHMRQCLKSAAMIAAAIVFAAPAFAQDIPSDDGLFMSKKVSSFNYDTMQGTLTLESFVTGEMKLVTSPFDVVLVLDNSSSMSGNAIKDLRSGCKSLVNQMNIKCNDGSNARLAIVTYNTSATQVAGLTLVNNAGKESLNSAIDGIGVTGTTHPEAGFEIAYNIITGRTDQTVPCFIIFFTDGMPGDNDGKMNVAQSSIAASWNVKQLGVKVYSIGLFSDDPSGRYIEQRKLKDSGMGYETVYGKALSVKNFLDHMSSLYNGVTSFDATKGNPGKITWNGNTAMNTDGVAYYRWAQSSGDLDGIFTDIGAQIIGTAAKPLTAETVVKDIISTDCSLPAGIQPTDIKVYSAACTGGDAKDGFNFNPKAPESTAVVTINDKTVNVTGFDYGQNWVGWNSSTNKFHGSKLIIEIPFTVNPDALVGKDISQIQTNATGSGIYEKGTSTEPAGRFPVPVVTYADFTVKKTGLQAGESAVFKIERKLSGESDYSYVTTMVLTGTSDDGTEVSNKLMYQDPSAMYKVTELTGWSWTYNTDSASIEKTGDANHKIEFEFVNTKNTGITIKNAERAAKNPFRRIGEIKGAPETYNGVLLQ